MKALYGLRTSGARWHDRFADTPRDEKYKPSLAYSDVLYRDIGRCYENVTVYVDDLCYIGPKSEKFYNILKLKHGFKLKGVEEISYHLGGNFVRDADGTLFWGSHTYIKKILDNYDRQFGSLPSRKPSSALENDDPPELDQSEILDKGDTNLYQPMIGAL